MTLLIALIGCGEDVTLWGDDSCVVEQKDISAAPVDEAEFWPLVDGLEMDDIEWQWSATTEPTSSLLLSIQRADGDASVVQRSGLTGSTYCRPGPDLVLPVRIDVSIGGGEAAWSSWEDLYVSGSSLDDVYFEGFQTTCLLSQSWTDAASAAMVGDFGPGDVTCLALVSGGLDRTSVDIVGVYVDQDVSDGLWSGGSEHTD